MRKINILILAAMSASMYAANPVVTGPVIAKVTLGDPSRDYPYLAALEDLKAKGYVEYEYFIAGTANRYQTPEGATGKVIDSNHKYQTRVIVRRPADSAKFNGTVIVEWNNVTAGHDQIIDWYQVHDYLMRSGYAFIAATPQRIGVDSMKVWNKQRYASLDVTVDGTINDDSLSYDVFADVGRAARNPNGTSLLGGLKPQRVIATGHSQSAQRLGIYVNDVHPLDPVYDAVIVHGGGTKIRTDLGRLKVFKILSETDVILSQAALRQPDTENFRSWEVAGDSHVDTQFRASSELLGKRDGNPQIQAPAAGGGRGGAQPLVPSAGTNPCAEPLYSHVPFYQVMDAAIDHLVEWVRSGKAPPTAQPIDVTTVGPPGVIARDANGNSSGGGIRLAELAVPTGLNSGLNTGPGFCRLYGSHKDFDDQKRAALYPSHEAYVAAVRDVTEKNFKAGYILRPEADATIAEANRSAIGTR